MGWFEVFSAVIALVIPVALFWFGRKLARMDKRGEARRQENVLILRGLDVIGGLAGATAIAFRDGHANGNVTTAMERYDEYKGDLKDYLYQQAANK